MGTYLLAALVRGRVRRFPPRRAPSLISVHGAFILLGSGDMMRDRCDVRSHVVSESVEGGWLMPGT
jgi:hypothetical protein